MKVKRKEPWLLQQYTGTLIALALMLVGLFFATTYLIQKTGSSDIKIIRLHLIALLLGLVFEYRRIAEKWSTVLWTAFGAYLLSFFAFARNKGERVYNFEDHAVTWPYFFLGFFVLIATVVHYTTVTKKITEGITLLLTIAINYWIFANDYWQSDFVFIKALIILNLLFSAFALFNAFSYTELGKGSRLALSIWSSVITLILSADNFLKIYKYRDIEHLPTFSESAFVFLQFFLLGVSGIYIAQNITMIGAYIPGKQYMETIREINQVHLTRYSKEQVYIVDSVIVFTISLTGFILNHFFQFLPVNFMIWSSITIVPVLLYITHKILG